MARRSKRPDRPARKGRPAREGTRSGSGRGQKREDRSRSGGPPERSRAGANPDRSRESTRKGRSAPERPAAPRKEAPRTRRPRGTPADLVDAPTLGRMLARHGFSLTNEQLDLLVRYHAILLDRNRSLNLTRILNLEDMVLKHYVDCFLVAKYAPKLPEPLLDIGSGAGFPGIPLKILFPDLHIILGEGVRKRVNFLREVREELKLERLDIIGRNIDRDFEYPVYGVITRAVESVRDTLKRARNCLMPGGYAYFMKGPNVDPEIEQALKRFPGLYSLAQDHAYNLPGSPYKRRLVVFEKHARPDEEGDDE